jgi:hypothetical protein
VTRVAAAVTAPVEALQSSRQQLAVTPATT